MKKIPTLFVRDFTPPSNGRWVTNQVTPGCEWVLAGEGYATRKWDGTCTMYDGENWWARREVKPGKNPPPNWIEVDHDETTGKRVGWEPIEQTGYTKFLTEALHIYDTLGHTPPPGTYELCGPKINGNPEQLQSHQLLAHGNLNMDATHWITPPTRTYDGLRAYMADVMDKDCEGIVWWHPDGRKAKLKRRDFPTQP